MRALPHPSRITILAVCLAVALAAILVIGCMRVMDTTNQPGGRPDAPAPVASAGSDRAAQPDARALDAAPPATPLADASAFAHMVEPLAARLFVLTPGPASGEPARTEASGTPVAPVASGASGASVAAAVVTGSDAPQPSGQAARPEADAAAKTAAAPQAAPQTPPQTSPKSPPRTVLVVGDSFAVGIGMTMAESLSQAKEVRLDQKGKTSSGLDNAKFHNWGKTLEGLLATARPDALVVMIGGNDAQNGPGTEVWAENYRRKASDFLGIAVKKNVPVYWVALPPMRDEGLNARVKTANTAMRAACESGPGCRFIDSWDLFSDDKGNYADEKNIGGKTVKLRGKDGVHFTMTGYRLLSDRILAGFAPNLELSQKK
jgi:lysophospholipase L1-like esterase